MVRSYRPERGPKPDRLMHNALVLALHRAAEDARGKPTKKLYQVADALVESAIGGDVGAIREIFDRVDGRVPQEQRHVGANGGPIQVEDNRPSIQASILGIIRDAALQDETDADATKH